MGKGGGFVRTPEWLDKSLYPFETKDFDIEHRRLSYVDVGHGEPIVFVHGTPTWSFMYRKAIEGLSGANRCVAMDNLGFGLSDKPATFVYRPEKQAEYLEALIESLGLKNITLFVHDFGGPIGLSYAIRHPANVKHIILTNTWMWSLRGNLQAEKANRLINRGLGRFLYLKMNFGPKYLMPMMIKDRTNWSKKVKAQYVSPFQDPESRYGAFGYAKALLGSSEWYQALWNEKDAIRNISALIIWGMKDPFFDSGFLDRWTSVFAEAEIHHFPHTGHFVPEEHGADMVPFVDMLMKDTAYLPTTTEV